MPEAFLLSHKQMTTKNRMVYLSNPVTFLRMRRMYDSIHPKDLEDLVSFLWTEDLITTPEELPLRVAKNERLWKDLGSKRQQEFVKFYGRGRRPAPTDSQGSRAITSAYEPDWDEDDPVSTICDLPAK
jgi:hypothetical protein